MKIVFICGPYIGNAPHDHRGYVEIERNILLAKAAMIALVQHGIGVFCPHTHSHGFELITPNVPAAFWYKLDQHFLKSCDAVLRLPGEGRGSDAEVTLAASLGIPIFYDIDDLMDWASVVTAEKEA